MIARVLLSLAAAAGMASVQAQEVNPVRPMPAAATPASLARVIVKYKASSAAMKAMSAASMASLPQQAQALGARLGLNLRDGRGMSSTMQLVHASGISSEQLAQRLAQDASVEWAVPDRRVRALMVPNDQYYGAGQTSPYPAVGQWYLRAPDATAPAAINAEHAWDTDKTAGAGQVVAILDTGIRPEHPDLQGVRLLAGYNMISLNTAAEDPAAAGKCITGNGLCRGVGATDPGDWVTPQEVSTYSAMWDNTCLSQTSTGTYVQSDSSWHGTQVAGIAAANTNNGSLGVAGIAHGAQILPVRVLGKCSGWDSDIIEGMRWAAGLAVSGVPANANPAKVINLSLGGTGACLQAYQTAINEVLAAGAVVVAAAGNDGTAVGAPGNCAGVVAVAGVRHSGTKVGYSNLGPEVTVSAPAGNCASSTGTCLYPIMTTANDGKTTFGNSIYSNGTTHISLGTSFSTPQVSGTVALMFAAHPQMTPAEVISMLKSTARAFPNSGAAPGSGGGPSGVVQACADPAVVTTQNYECYCTKTTCGAGMLDANAAVKAAAAGATVARITASPSSPLVGQTITLDSSTSSAATGHTIPGSGYAWAITAGAGLTSNVSSANAATFSFDATAAGTVSVQLTVTDDKGLQASTVQSLTISAASTGGGGAGGSGGSSGGSGGGAWSPWWSLGLLLAALALPGRRQRCG